MRSFLYISTVSVIKFQKQHHLAIQFQLQLFVWCCFFQSQNKRKTRNHQPVLFYKIECTNWVICCIKLNVFFYYTDTCTLSNTAQLLQKYSCTLSIGFKCSQMTLKAGKCSQMIGMKWFQIVFNGPEWPEIVSNGPL